jgi:hypothetical protein
MLAASAALYLTAFVRETNPRTAILPAFGDPPKQKWWRRLMNTKTSVVEAGRFVMNRYNLELEMFNNFIFDLVPNFASYYFCISKEPFALFV